MVVKIRTSLRVVKNSGIVWKEDSAANNEYNMEGKAFPCSHNGKLFEIYGKPGVIGVMRANKMRERPWRSR